MKKAILLKLFLFFSTIISAQIKESYPYGFRKAEIYDEWKKKSEEVSLKLKPVDNYSSANLLRTIPFSENQSNALVETLIGNSFYDLQSNSSISNRFIMNSDGTLSATWTFSPNAIQTTTPPFPSRGTGYNYWDGNFWIYPTGPTSRQEPVRTGSPNIVVTPSGKEMIISHSLNNNQTDSNNITVLWRSMKGTGSWDTLIHPWGTNTCYTLSKACGGLTNENVYIIFLGNNGSVLPVSPPSANEGYYGPIIFARSLDGGITWSTPVIIPLIDSTNYMGFIGDSYSIMAAGDTVAISYGNTFTDVGLLKSTDAGLTWTKEIIQLHALPLYNIIADSITDVNHDGIADTILSNSGDSKVLIDNNGMCHVWFSALRYLNDTTGDSSYTAFYATDNLYYWNESMPQNNGYVAIAAAQDFDGNGVINFPPGPFPPCYHYPFFEYGGGITQMPSAGIDANGKIYLAYQTVDERTDPLMWGVLHKHVFMITLAPVSGVYNPAAWTYPYEIIPNIASGGYGENQEGVFACVTPKVGNNDLYVLYLRDDQPGHSLAYCGVTNSSDIIIAKIDVNTVGVKSVNSDNLFVGQNYPNPTSGLTYINIGLKKNADVIVEVFDISGRVIYCDARGNYAAGSHTLTLNLSKLSSGVYTYSVAANGEKSTRKLVINK